MGAEHTGVLRGGIDLRDWQTERHVWDSRLGGKR